MTYVERYTWDERRKSEVVRRFPVRTTLNANDLLVSTRHIARESREDLVPSTYSRARDLVRWPDRMAAGRTKPSVCRDGIGTKMAKSFASKRAQEAYALRAELGERAYAELTGARKRSTTKARKSTSKDLAAAVRAKANDGGVVRLSPDELASVLRHKAGTIRMADID